VSLVHDPTRTGRFDVIGIRTLQLDWVPAFAGMTGLATRLLKDCRDRRGIDLHLLATRLYLLPPDSDQTLGFVVVRGAIETAVEFHTGETGVLHQVAQFLAGIETV